MSAVKFQILKRLWINTICKIYKHKWFQNIDEITVVSDDLVVQVTIQKFNNISWHADINYMLNVNIIILHVDRNRLIACENEFILHTGKKYDIIIYLNVCCMAIWPYIMTCSLYVSFLVFLLLLLFMETVLLACN